ncbi:MAG TPA: plastocyanin/azurin family copper-binding protein [Acidimicrobiia bacterium]|nr:plastocyanin/azurin family copper-binding protein [Acidimicrobiia bacterium]
MADEEGTPEPDAATDTPAEPVAALPAAPHPAREARRTRLVLPIFLPVLAAFMVAVFVLNVSRVFLASGQTGALVMAVTLIVVILGGAAAISAAPRLRTSSLVMLVSGLFVVIMAAGLVAAPASVEKKSGGGGLTEPKGPPAGPPVEVDALGTLKFQAAQFTATAGIVQVNYVSKDGNHTLTFDPPGPTPRAFLLNVPANGNVTHKVLLKPGSYTLYCTLPGHRAAGMVATLTVQ